MMKRIILAFLFCAWQLTAWADQAELIHLRVLPLGTDRAVVEVSGIEPKVDVGQQEDGYPALLFEDTRFIPALVGQNQLLSHIAYLRSAPYPIKVKTEENNTWLVFQSTTSVTFFVVTQDDAFLNEIARELPLYPHWPSPKNTVNRTEKQQRLAITQAEKSAYPIQTLEGLLKTTAYPIKPLYQALADLYAKQPRTEAEALCLYAQGTEAYPEAFGLHYSGLLYQYHQPDKAILVLSDLIQKPLPAQTKAQAQYMVGSMQMEKQEFQNALSHLKAAAAVFDNNPTVLYNLGVAYEATNQKELAHQTYQRALPYAKGDLQQELQSRISSP